MWTEQLELPDHRAHRHFIKASASHQILQGSSWNILPLHLHKGNSFLEMYFQPRCLLFRETIPHHPASSGPPSQHAALFPHWRKHVLPVPDPNGSFLKIESWLITVCPILAERTHSVTKWCGHVSFQYNHRVYLSLLLWRSNEKYVHNVLRIGPCTKNPECTVVTITSIIKAEHIIKASWENFLI